MALLVGYALVRAFFSAAAKPFWLDEFCTLAIASQPGVHGILALLKRGIDSAPPPFYLLEAASLKLSSNKEIALRLPEILAFPCTLLCVFVFVRKRCGEAIACLCSFLLLSTTIFTIYSMEARSYSLLMALVAFAMVCYQRLPSARWTALLGFSLVLAESVHYFAVFPMAPFWMAEAVLLLQTRRIRWGVWLALACGLLPLVAFWPLLASYRSFYGSHIVFSHPALGKVPEYWGSFFLTDPPYGAGLALAALAAIAWTRFSYQDGLPAAESNERDWSQGTLLAGMTVLPVIAFVLVRVTHANLTNRYVLASTLGLAAAIGLSLTLVRPKVAALFAIFLLASVGLREYGFWRNGHHPMAGDLTVLTREEFARVERFVLSAGQTDLPVVYGPELSYIRMAYYSSPDWDRRVVHLVDEELEQRYVGNDSIPRISRPLAEFLPLQLRNYSEFIGKHREFLLYSDGTDWMLDQLALDAASVRLLKTEGSSKLYLVRM